MSAERQPPADLFVDERRAKRLEAAVQSVKRFASEADSSTRLWPERVSKGGVDKARARVREMAETGDWSEATGTHFVAFYEWLHLTVYGVEASELAMVGEWARAAAAAARMLDTHFGGDATVMTLFVRWTWNRESDTEKWRRENKKPGGRIGWRLQFSGAKLTDYKLDVARQGR